MPHITDAATNAATRAEFGFTGAATVHAVGGSPKARNIAMGLISDIGEYTKGPAIAGITAAAASMAALGTIDATATGVALLAGATHSVFKR